MMAELMEMSMVRLKAAYLEYLMVVLKVAQMVAASAVRLVGVMAVE